MAAFLDRINDRTGKLALVYGRAHRLRPEQTEVDLRRDQPMRNAAPLGRKAIVIRCIAAIAASAVLTGCAMHQGDRKMRMDAMQESPMHQMMKDMGCAHDASQMQAMEKMSKEEKHAHMKAQMQACMSKMRQRAADEERTRIETCVEARMNNRVYKRTGANKMRAMMMADLRTCASQTPPAEAAPAKPSTHDGH
jgi:outer membrane PBP1 activator LpoA protein